MLPLPPKNHTEIEPGLLDAASRATPIGRDASPPPRRLRDLLPSIVRSGLLGYGLLLSAVLLALDLRAGRSGLMSLWWLFYPVVYLVSSVAYGGLRWFLFGGIDPKETRGARWLTRTTCGGLAFVALIAFLLIAGPGSYIACGRSYPARFTITVVDEDGAPVPGVELRLLGPVRPTRAMDLAETRRTGKSVDLEGSWPLLEVGDTPLRTDGDGRLIVHQAEPMAFSEHGVVFFGRHFPLSQEESTHSLEFRHPSFHSKQVPFYDLPSSTPASAHTHVEGPGGVRMADIDVGVVMHSR